VQSSNIPSTKLLEAFAASASGSFIRLIPKTTSDPNAASLDLGFPPTTFTNEGAGGVAPAGKDMNGILNEISAWIWWQNGGGSFLPYDGVFQAAVGGYPKGAVVASVATFGLFWLSTAENNTSDPDTGGSGWIRFGATGLQLQNGQCQLVYTSGSQITLLPGHGGNNLLVAGQNCSIPAAGVNLAPSGLTPGTPYYIYAAQTSGVISSLVPSTTGHITDTTAGNVGNEIMSGDPTKTLVGYWLVGSGPAWSSNPVQGLNWFHQKPRSTTTTLSSTVTSASTSVFELSSSIRNSFLSWAANQVRYDVTGSVNLLTPQNAALTAVGFDGTTPEVPGSMYESFAASTTGNLAFSGIKTGLSETASHYATLLGVVSIINTGTVNWQGGNAVISSSQNPPCTLVVTVDG